jgi:tetratricopeptide (TPR) repeat protein
MATNSKSITQFFLLKFIAASLLLLESGVLLAQNQPTTSACGPLNPPGQYGPFDYRTDGDKLPIVLGAHFTPEVESLIRGHTSSTPGGDIDYTLRAIPNNHRALISMMRLGEKEKTPQPRGSRYTVECWFERAIQFRPDDSIVRMIYSTYLNSQGRLSDAKVQLQTASTYAKDNGFTHYNIGLHYFDLKDYDQALVQAHKAMALDFPRTELSEKLQSVGKWVAPSAEPATQVEQSTATPPSK